MIKIRVAKTDDLIDSILITGHSEDRRVCSSVSMAIEISRKLLGGSTPMTHGGFYYVSVARDQEAQARANAIVDALNVMSSGVRKYVGNFVEIEWQPSL